MYSRSLILMGLCAALGVATPAVAEVAKPQKSVLFPSKSKQADEPKAAAEKQTKKSASKSSQKKGKEEVAKLTPEEKAKLKAEAAEKARQAKLLALRAKAKADAEARREAARGKSQSVEVAEDDPQPNKKGAKLFTLASAGSAPASLTTAAVPVTGLTKERVAAQQAARVGADEVLRAGNNGELRSGDVATRNAGFLQILFGDEPATTASLLPETRALDTVLDKKKKFRLKPEYEMQVVEFSGYPRGTIVIDTANHFLYLVESSNRARRYGIAVGRDGLQYKGTVAVGDKQEWPRWIPTKEMQQREPAKYARYAEGMPGGGENPLGARAIYLYQGKQDTHLRIHGTIAPQSIGTNSSNGCFRMVNEHVIDLYNRVRMGMPVVVL
ncbi:L,D-transpeptidase [Pseudaminobacter sp. 19-2017]|uniref:L,D-transpeptidase n=1 Tax=Pseudaminobacter soli (ex Zhang et al. 2022) TaxID=2831468 RepID=A0A942E0W0_9HYPH|nr:L,D-transpeptidase [Pseudaminobacter soli]MBS3651331.1 L,D-transpeptidase [Pseudaminobacter soli]